MNTRRAKNCYICGENIEADFRSGGLFCLKDPGCRSAFIPVSMTRDRIRSLEDAHLRYLKYVRYILGESQGLE